MGFIYKAKHSIRLPSKGAGREFASGLRDLIGSLVKGAGCEQREQTEGLKKNTTYLKLIHPHKIPPSCLRQPTSLYMGGKKRIKGHAHSF